MSATLAAGTFALAFVVGHGVLDGFASRGKTRLGLVRVVLACALGVTLLTPVLVLLAQVSVFVPEVIGAAGWFALGVWIVARRRTRWRIEAAWAEAILLVAAAAFVLIGWRGHGEPWGAGRDQQVYATSALALVNAHAATSRIAPSDQAEERLLDAIAGNPRIERYLGMQRSVRDGVLETASYLPIGWTVWLAIAASIGGLPALYLANVVICAVAALLLYPILRRAVGPALAVAASVILLALPSTRWVSGVTLSEPIAMLVFLAVMALLAVRRSRALGWVPSLMFAMSCIRIDALAISPMLALAGFICALEARRARERGQARMLAAALVVATVGTIGWYAAFSRPYLSFNWSEIVSAAALTVAIAALTFAPKAIRELARTILRARATRSIVPAIIVAVLAYAVIVRPELSPFSLIHNGSGLDGTRDFREESVRDLAAYLGWPLVVLATLGVLVAVRRMLSAQRAFGLAAWTISGIGVSALYLTAPLVSPDYPWAIRRMIPVVIPCACMFAAIAAYVMFSRVRTWRRTGSAALLVAAGFTTTVAQGTTLMGTRENAGMGTEIAVIARSLPDALVVCDLPLANVCEPMAQAFGRRVVVADASDAAERKAIANWFEEKAAAGRATWLLHAPELSMTGVRVEATGRWQLARTFIAPTSHPPASTVRTQWLEADLSRIDGLDPRVAWQRFGGSAVWGMADRGFYPSAIASCGTVRMTDGDATIEIPANRLARARFLAADLFSWAPRGETRPTTVRVGDHEVWSGTLGPGISSIAFALPETASKEVVAITIRSATFDPRAFDPADSRTRVGIGLLGLRALARPIDEASPGVEGARGVLRILRHPHLLASGVSGSFALGLANRGSSAWNPPRTSGDGRGTAVGVRWYRQGHLDAPVAESRFDLPLALLPGDHDAFEIPLVARTQAGDGLPPATYDVVATLERGDRARAIAGAVEFRVEVTP